MVAGMPNFSERMNREGVDYEEVTAGAYFDLYVLICLSMCLSNYL